MSTQNWIESGIRLTASYLLLAAAIHGSYIFASVPGDEPLKGRLSLQHGTPADFKIYRDDFDSADATALALNYLPPFEVDLVQLGDSVVPLQRGPQPGEHPYWEYVFEPGRLLPAIDGRPARVLELPLSLQETNANCLHNGILSLELAPTGQVTKAHYGINSETCMYLKFDLIAELELAFDTRPELTSAPAEERHRDHTAHRLPVKSYAELESDFPKVDVGAFYGGSRVSEEHITTAGLIINNIHYSSGCPTRAGEHGACEDLSVPSYSLAKSLVGGLALMRLEKLYPGAVHARVADLLPACADWGSASLADILNMTTGRYGSAKLYSDENSDATAEQFFLATTHQQKINYSCKAWPERAPPGETWVYHTTDTYILGAAINAFLRKHRGDGADYYEELITPLWKSIALSASSDSIRRTRDSTAQAFTGFGLTLLPDDIARLGVALNQGAFDDQLDRKMLFKAMQRDPTRYKDNLPVGGMLYYQHGFWAIDVTGLLGCADPLLIPYMSGYGGINLLMMPNDTVYYLFSDNGEFAITSAIAESHRLRPMCQVKP